MPYYNKKPKRRKKSVIESESRAKIAQGFHPCGIGYPLTLSER